MADQAKTKNRKSRTRRNDGYSVYKHRSGRWEWLVTVGYHENGTQKRLRGYAETRDDAVASAQAAAHKKRSGTFVPTTKDSLLEDYLWAWLELRIKPHREPKTVSYYEANIKHHLAPTLGKTPLRKLTAQAVQKLINDKLADKKSPATVHGIIRTLRTALTTAWKEGLIEQNVAQRVTMPKLEHKDAQYLQPADARALLDASVGHPLENLIAFTLASGVRIGEATGLTWDNVDLERKEVAIVHQLQRIDGKLVLKGLKSKSSRRALALSDIAFDALNRAQFTSAWAKANLSGEASAMNLVFVNPEGRPIDPKYAHHHLKKLCVAAGVKEVGFHKLRHTAATLMVAAGVELHQVKEQLGHSQIALTANLYAHNVTEAQRKAVDKLDEVLKRGKIG